MTTKTSTSKTAASTKVVARPEAAKRTRRPAAPAKAKPAAKAKAEPRILQTQPKPRTKAPKATPVEPAPAVETIDPAKLSRIERLNVAKVESAALRSWKAAGEPEPRPETPVLDWMANPANSEAKKAKASTTSTSRRSDEEAAAIVERCVTARNTGVSFPALAVALNAESFLGRTDWTGPKLYAIACRHNVGKLPLVKA